MKPYGEGIACPACGHPSMDVKNSRAHLANDGIRRRRVCEKCGHRVSTIEIITTDAPVVFISGFGRRSPQVLPLDQYLKEVQARLIEAVRSTLEINFRGEE